MYGIPEWLIITFIFTLGSIMGSFLDVFILRFHTGKSINGRSHCLSCGHTLDWFELFPLFSYLFLKGRCRICHANIPARLFLMEILTGFLFVLAWSSTVSLPELLIGCLFIMVALVITIYDVRHMVIPNAFVIVMTGVALVSLGVRLWLTGDVMTLVPYIVSGFLASSFYASLWLVSKGEWIGLGDAKLALPLGMMLSAYQTFSFVVLSFWVGAVISVTLLLLQWIGKRGQNYLRFLDIPLTMKSEVPFAPFLLIAFALVYFFNLDVLSLFSMTI